MIDKIKKFMLGGEKEKEVIEKFKEHIALVIEANEILKTAIEQKDAELIKEICEIERHGDVTRREIVLMIYEGAFIPALRANFCRLAESIDEILDTVEDVAILYLMIGEIKEDILADIIRISEVNLKMSKKLLETFENLEKDEDMSEKLLKIKISEEEVDSIKGKLYPKLKDVQFNSFAEWHFFINFVEKMITVSDLIEDSADIIQIINVSLR